MFSRPTWQNLKLFHNSDVDKKTIKIRKNMVESVTWDEVYTYVAVCLLVYIPYAST